MIQVHYAAVHQISSVFYSAEIIEAWSRRPDEARYKWMREVIAKGDVTVMVAEDGPAVVGFGMIDPQLAELRALYVAPESCHRGIGGKILMKLELCARTCGVSRLHVNASLNADQFYRRHGYEFLARGTQRLNDHEMDCLKMAKNL